MSHLQAKLVRLGAFLVGLAVGIPVLLALGLGRRDGGAKTPEADLRRLPSPGADKDWDPSLGSPPRFADVTEASGITFRHENGHTGKFNYLEIMGGGVGLLDYNGDGLLDLYFVNGNRLDGKPDPQITNHLYRNNGDWTFTDVTASAGVGDASYGQGVCAADYDNDGDTDIYVSNFGPNVLYRNDGNGKFTDVAAAVGVADPLWGQSSSFLDYNGDGWLDLYVQNYLTFSLDPQVERPVPFIQLGDRRVPDYPSPANYRGSPNRLYRNNRNGTFSDVTAESGIFRPEGKGMGCACADLNDDGRVDIFVANDGIENFLFRNRGNGSFEEIGLAAGVAFDGNGIPEGSMGVDVGDYDRDGRLDLSVPCLRRQSFTLYHNEGDHFSDASRATGLDEATSAYTGFSPNFLDYDNDGDLDLFFSMGSVRANELAPMDASYFDRYGLPHLLLANDGTGRFRDVSRWAGPHFQKRMIGRGSAAGDLDNDGDMDLVISNLAGSPVILRNESPSGHWITLSLRPRTGSRDAMGSSVWVEAGGVKQRAVVHGGVTYLSQNDRRVHFGLGKAEKVDRLTVEWPDRERQAFENVAADRFATITQGESTVK